MSDAANLCFGRMFFAFQRPFVTIFKRGAAVATGNKSANRCAHGDEKWLYLMNAPDGEKGKRGCKCERSVKNRCFFFFGRVENRL